MDTNLPFDPGFFAERTKKEGRLSAKEVFTEIYQTDHWSGGQSRSGAGSDDEQTELVRQHLPVLLAQLGVKRFLDLPCGDFHWMQWVDLPVEEYIGGDIVEDLIRANQATYGRPGRRFEVLDLLGDPLPQADLILCRDCLVHLSFADIWKALENIRRSGIGWLLTTSFSDRKKNEDIVTGDWRTLNLQLEPFWFPASPWMLNENCTEGNGAYSDKCLMLWKVADLKL